MPGAVESFGSDYEHEGDDHEELLLKRAAAGLLSHAVGRTERLSAWNEVFALVLLFVGTLLFFALISYTPKDIPSWFWFSHVSPANHPAQNFI